MTPKEKIDSFSKILLATQTINYMAAQINQVKKDMEHIVSQNQHNNQGSVARASANDKEYLLGLCVGRLSDIMELLGNHMNNTDTIMPIDRRITDTAFEIIIHGKDNVEK